MPLGQQHGGMSQRTAVATASLDDLAAPEPHVLRCESTADLLAALPLATGYTDGHSLFIMLFRGKRSCGTARMELPCDQSAGETEALIEGVIALLGETGAGADSPAFVITTSQSFGEQRGTPWLRFARRLERRLSKRGWRAREFAVLAADGWRSLHGDSELPRSLREIANSRLALQADASRFGALHREPRTLDELGRLPQPDPHRSQAVARQLRTIEQRRASEAARTEPETAAGAALWLPGTARVAEACFGTSRGRNGRRSVEPRLLARLIDAAQNSDRWLVLALTAMTRAEFLVGVAEEFADGRFERVPLEEGPAARPSWSVLGLLVSLAQDVPEPEQLGRTIDALGDAAAHAPEPQRPALLALLAWAWWLRGLQSVSLRFVAQALSIDAGHELTLMVERLIEAPAAAHLDRLRASLSEPEPAPQLEAVPALSPEAVPGSSR